MWREKLRWSHRYGNFRAATQKALKAAYSSLAAQCCQSHLSPPREQLECAAAAIRTGASHQRRLPTPALGGLVVWVRAAGMVGCIDDLSDAGDLFRDQRLNPLLQRHIRHATPLAAPAQSDIG